MGKNRIAHKVSRAGKTLHCSFCDGMKFYHREAQLNTRLMSLFDLDWINPKGDCYICANCRHIMWFYSETAKP